MRGAKWNEKEIDILRNNYATTKTEKLVLLLPNRSAWAR